MAKQRKLPKLTAEEIAERELHQEWVRERIAYHTAMAEKEEARRTRKSFGRRLRERLKLAA